MAGGEEPYTPYMTPISRPPSWHCRPPASGQDKGEVMAWERIPALREPAPGDAGPGRNRAGDMEAWFRQADPRLRGQRVKIGGTFADLYRVARAGLDKGMTCEFGPDRSSRAAAE